MNLLTKYEIASGMTIKNLSKEEISRRKNLQKRVKHFFTSLENFNKLSEEEKDKRMAICRI